MVIIWFTHNNDMLAKLNNCYYKIDYYLQYSQFIEIICFIKKCLIHLCTTYYNVHMALFMYNMNRMLNIKMIIGNNN